MNILIAPDSFRGSLSALEAAQAIAAGLAQALPEAQLMLKPMADGGEGTLGVLLAALGGERRAAWVEGPLGQRLKAVWGWQPQTRTALIELAAASGLALLQNQPLKVLRASTFGTGQLVRAALDAGAQHIVLALGGSASVDGGSGLLQALGARLLDAQGKPIGRGGAALAQLSQIDLASLDRRLAGVGLELLCDVDNPLCGSQGAAAVFAPQKGANAAQVAQLEAALAHFAQQARQFLGQDFSTRPGSGAAGGSGFALQAFLRGKSLGGALRVAEIIGLAEAIAHCDWVISGEGSLDAQTLHGKVVAGVLQLASARQVPLVALAGNLGEGYQALYARGLTAAFSLASGPLSLQQSSADAARLLRERAQDIARLWQNAALFCRLS